jgi:hypothetical protein
MRLSAPLLFVAASLAVLVPLGESSGAGQPRDRVPRPTDPASLFAYETQEVKRYFGRRAVIHYVTRGQDAPPRTDLDRDAIPDYVEDASAVADASLEYFERPVSCLVSLGYCLPPGILAPFRKVRLDREGPDSRPDVYIRAGVAGLGTAIPPTDAVGGAFVVISPDLDARLIRPRSGLLSVLAHEMFHLVEFSYVPRGMPTWVSEGVANAMAAAVATERAIALGLGVDGIVDATVAAQYDLWLREPWRSIYSQEVDCPRCYGNLVWWSRTFYLGSVLQRFYELAARHSDSIGLGLHELDAAFAQNQGDPLFERSLYDAFAAHSREMFIAQNPGMLRPLAVATEQRASPVPRSPKPRSARRPSIGYLAGLSTHYLPLAIPEQAAELHMRVEVEAGPAPEVVLFVGPGRLSDGTRHTRALNPSRGRALFLGRRGHAFVFTVNLTETESGEVVLMIASRRASGARYRLAYRAS